MKYCYKEVIDDFSRYLNSSNKRKQHVKDLITNYNVKVFLKKI